MPGLAFKTTKCLLSGLIQELLSSISSLPLIGVFVCYISVHFIEQLFREVRAVINDILVSCGEVHFQSSGLREKLEHFVGKSRSAMLHDSSHTKLLSRHFAQFFNSVEIQFYIGDAYFQTGQYENAIAEYVKIPLLSRKTKLQWEASALYYSGQAYEKLGRIDDAKRMYAEIVKRPGIDVVLKKEAQKRIKEIEK